MVALCCVVAGCQEAPEGGDVTGRWQTHKLTEAGEPLATIELHPDGKYTTDLVEIDLDEQPVARVSNLMPVVWTGSLLGEEGRWEVGHWRIRFIPDEPDVEAIEKMSLSVVPSQGKGGEEESEETRVSITFLIERYSTEELDLKNGWAGVELKRVGER
jgi:hypothetical protein